MAKIAHELWTYVDHHSTFFVAASVFVITQVTDYLKRRQDHFQSMQLQLLEVKVRAASEFLQHSDEFWHACHEASRLRGAMEITSANHRHEDYERYTSLYVSATARSEAVGRLARMAAVHIELLVPPASDIAYQMLRLDERDSAESWRKQREDLVTLLQREVNQTTRNGRRRTPRP